MSRLMEAAMLIYGALNLAALVYTIACMCRRDTTTPEELERASMRSCSWPTDGSHFPPIKPLSSPDPASLP